MCQGGSERLATCCPVVATILFFAHNRIFIRWKAQFLCCTVSPPTRVLQCCPVVGTNLFFRWMLSTEQCPVPVVSSTIPTQFPYTFIKRHNYSILCNCMAQPLKLCTSSYCPVHTWSVAQRHARQQWFESQLGGTQPIVPVHAFPLRH